MKLFIEEISDGILIGNDNDSTPSGYVDKTTIIDVGTNAMLHDRMEYNSKRKWLLELLLKKNPDQGTAFGMCSPQEQSIICKYLLMPYSVRLLFFTDEQDAEHWETLVTRTEGNPIGLLEGRALIYQRLRIAVSHHVRKETWTPGDYFANLTMAQMFFRDVQQMKDLFIGSNDYEFRDFLSSSGMYDTTTGFKSKTYWFQDLENELLSIYYSY